MGFLLLLLPHPLTLFWDPTCIQIRWLSNGSCTRSTYFLGKKRDFWRRIEGPQIRKQLLQKIPQADSNITFAMGFVWFRHEFSRFSLRIPEKSRQTRLVRLWEPWLSLPPQPGVSTSCPIRWWRRRGSRGWSPYSGWWFGTCLVHPPYYHYHKWVWFQPSPNATVGL